jgi:hypothetical protein
VLSGRDVAIENGPTHRSTPHRINPLPVPFAVESDRIHPPAPGCEHDELGDNAKIMPLFYSISQNTPQLAEVPKLAYGMNGQGRRHCRTIVLNEYLNKTRTRRGKIPAMGDVPKGHP